jgi:hypothetical protein
MCSGFYRARRENLMLPFCLFFSFQGMPEQWSKLLTGSAITREDYAQDTQAVLDVLEYYTGHQKRETEEMAAVARGLSGLTGSPAQFNVGTGLGGMGKISSPLADGRWQPATDEATGSSLRVLVRVQGEE